MSEPIKFDCTSCGMPYKVAASYAGREFACKKCGARLCVPHPRQTSLPVEPEVELGSGTEVMRRVTPSGRQVAADPTRVFRHERETSQRMVAVSSEERAKSGKGLLIAGIIVGVLAMGGVIAAVIVLSGDEQPAPAANGKTVAVGTPGSRTPSERDKLMARLDEGLDAKGLLALMKEAQGKVEDADLTVIGQRLVRAVSNENGGALSDAEIMDLARGMAATNVPADTERLYMVVINRHRKTDPRPEVYVLARETLGYSRLDFDSQLERARSLAATGVVEGMNGVAEELDTLSKRADDGWSTTADRLKYEDAVSKLDAAQAGVDEIREKDPFQFKLVSARLAFVKEKASTTGKWTSIGSAPFVFFVQLQAGEDDAGARRRVESAINAADQFVKFFENELRAPMELARSLPHTLQGKERESAPIVFKLFRDPSYWKVHLTELGHRDIDVTRTRAFTEPGTGHVSLVYESESESQGRFISAVVDAFVYNYHPHAPVTLEQDENFRAYSTYILALYLNPAIARVDEASSVYTFMPDDPERVTRLGSWMKPFEKDDRGRVVSFGGQILTVKELVGLKDGTHMRQTISDKLGTFDGWSEADLMAIRSTRTLDSLGISYLGGFYNFMWHWGSNKYRAKFLKFLRADLNGEVDSENPLPAFEKAFGLDEAGWKQLEADFTTYQSGG